jgi:superfamily II DNA/RNA helicase
MHIANLDTVVVVGRPAGPDEYIHIAGRTGRAGRSGKVISVLSEQHTAAIKGWETILNIEFKILDSMNDISSI